MNPIEIKGIITPIVTPMNPSYAIRSSGRLLAASTPCFASAPMARATS